MKSPYKEWFFLISTHTRRVGCLGPFRSHLEADTTRRSDDRLARTTILSNRHPLFQDAHIAGCKEFGNRTTRRVNSIHVRAFGQFIDENETSEV